MVLRRLVLMSLAATLACVFLSGCGAAPEAGGRDGSEPPQRTEGPEQADSSNSSRPPESTLSYGGDTITGALGTYCWGSASGSICVDKAGYPVSEETLTVPAGSTLTFTYGGGKLDSLSISAHRIGQGHQLKEINGGSMLIPNEGGEGQKAIQLHTHRVENLGHVAAVLPAGEYVVSAFVRVPQGDAVYGFRVVVE